MARPLADRLALGVTASTGAVLALTSARPVMPPFLPIGDYAPYGPDSPLSTVAFDALLHAPWFGAHDVVLSTILAAAVLAALWRACRVAGSAHWAALVAVIALAIRPDTGVALALSAPPLLALAAVWVALSIAADTRPRRWSTAALVLATAAAVALWLPALVLAPVMVGRARDAWRSLAPVAASTAAIALGTIVGGWGTVWLASSMLGVTLTGADLWRATTATSASSANAYPWPPLAMMALPLALALAGAAERWRRAASRPWGTAIGLVLSLLVAVSATAWRAEMSRALAWASWPLVAAGLTWVAAQAAHRHRLAAAVMAALLLGSSASARLRQAELAEPAAFAQALSTALGRRPLPLTVVVEDPRVDTALVAWGGSDLRRLIADPDLVSRTAEGGVAVLTGPGARAALEMDGLRFRPGVPVAAPVAFELAEVMGRFRCVAVGARWSELSGLEFTGRLGVHVPRGHGQLDVVVSGVAPLAVSAATADGRRIGTVVVAPARDLDSLPPVLWPGDGRLPPPETLAARVAVPASPDYAIDQAIALGTRAPLVAARMVGGASAARICAAPLPRFDPFDASSAVDVTVPLGDAVPFAAGFHRVEGSGREAFRWTGRRAVVLVPSSQARAVTFHLDARPAVAPGDAPVALEASVNGVPLGARTMSNERASYEWSVPATVWVDGTSEILLTVSRTTPPSAEDRRELGLAVYGLRLTRR